MCGIAGFTRFSATPVMAEAELARMNRALHHRGPDAGDQYLAAAVGLCHRRLSILDLSPAGAQPMTSHCGRYVMVYNGEIYNFQALRADLAADGAVFRGHSDSEVLLALYERDGPDCLALLNGMFALAIWDTREQTLFLARDRLGKKPLYFYRHNDQFAFASEIKAILCLPGIDTSLRMDAVADYFTYQYVPDPKSIYRHIHKLPPGWCMTVDARELRQRQYWDVSFAHTDTRREQDIEDELIALLEDSVRIRLASDVPLGAFLSGGIDSSAIVGLMASATGSPVTTCSIGFDSAEHDEVDAARDLAGHFQTDHHEFTVRDNVEDSLLDIAAWFDEPFADPSFVPTYFVSRLARQRVTVALSGDGGDENFAGYAKYLTDATENRLRNCLPAGLRRQLLSPTAHWLERTGQPLAQRAASLLGSLAVEPDQGFAVTNAFFRRSLWDALIVDELKRESAHYDPASLTRDLYHKADTDDHLSRLLYVDLKSYLPGDVLVKVDRMSMANSLETRAPLLDYRLVEFAASLPARLKLNGRTTKYILRNSVSRLLPEQVLTRRKQGFSVPLAQWLRQEIRELSQHYLLAADSGLSNFFDRARLQQLWQAHQAGRADHSAELWSLLMFELWWQRYQAAPVRAAG